MESHENNNIALDANALLTSSTSTINEGIPCKSMLYSTKTKFWLLHFYFEAFRKKRCFHFFYLIYLSISIIFYCQVSNYVTNRIKYYDNMIVYNMIIVALKWIRLHYDFYEYKNICR